MPLTLEDKLKLLMADSPLPVRLDDHSSTQADRAPSAKLDMLSNTPAQAGPPEGPDDIFDGPAYVDDNIEIVGEESDDDMPPPPLIHTETRRDCKGKGKGKGKGQGKDEGKGPPRDQPARQASLPQTAPLANLDAGTGSVEGAHAAPPVLGQLSPPGEAFCPLKAVQKYPYRHVNREGQEKVSQAFFAGGRFWDRAWDLFYLHPPAFTVDRALLFVPARQVHALLGLINAAFDTHLVFPHQAADLGFLLRFDDDHTPRPRFLGRAQSKLRFEQLESMVPDENFKPDSEAAPAARPADRSLAAFRRKMELAIDAAKNKSRASKAKKKEDRVQRQQAWAHQIKRTQRYLGLRQRREDVDMTQLAPLVDVSATPSWDDVGAAELLEAKASAAATPVLDLGRPAPFPPESAVIFISVDVESFERNHNLVTEIGVATLDTRDLVGLAPGEAGKAWIGRIRARHFRIQEYAHLRNKDFVDGCADQFEFGDSEFVSIRNAASAVAACFRDPFSNPTGSASAVEEKRNIVLLGHDTNADVAYLRSVGYDVLSQKGLVEVLDTAAMYRALKREVNPRALGTILYELGMVGWNLHNAGNDAAYTLQAMLAIALRHLQQRSGPDPARAAQRAEAVKSAVQDATERALDECEGWSSGGEGSDGGVPVDRAPEKPALRAGGKPTDGGKPNTAGRAYNAGKASAAGKATLGARPTNAGGAKARAHGSRAADRSAAEAVLARHVAAAKAEEKGKPLPLPDLGDDAESRHRSAW
ncbi:MAG: hypothetical protein M1832_001360 [Thelocarpon impressellum]|nr:MAG: hypothetical protein M1832_001360 [Thelocarpon impressellum]